MEHSPFPPPECLDGDTYVIDLGYGGQPQVSSAYLLVDEYPTLVETGATPGLDRLIAGVEAAGLRMEDVRYVAVTHIHLDHSGAAGVLVNRYPHLTVFVHPAGARHLADPSRLLRSAERVFRDQLGPLFGQVMPVPEDRIRVLQDGESIRLGRRTLVALDTPGHASHHHAYWEPERKWVYTGDVAGIRLPGSDEVMPPTPPPDIDVEAWRASLDKIRQLGPQRILYTHFGWDDHCVRRLDQVEKALLERAEAVREGLRAGMSLAAIIGAFQERFGQAASPLHAQRKELAASSTMNVEGLVRYWVKKKGEPEPR